ncbi:MAG: adenylyl-sulfate kinase [Pseudobutyrivibrio sp.]|uniref:adenylyl-sulfate kinase n=1 Tax=Pseudobutyrivibrio sp. TaxID=2014367 RepID=UPI0025D1A501|nr:adenylyl-sulfate kinase [Pseudobutyrivibrio sp.]MBQ6463543.1 adenylyl-sulfate kinase [Pseudobutyrivibrio sp.]MBQ8489525.1 adenylyl-sulfate kinase [Pseudobutyrivibrio sp.]
MKKFLLYFIGTSGSGKTTIASALENELNSRNIQNYQFIDGDDIRDKMGGIFGYTYEERIKCEKVVCVVFDYLLSNNISVIVTQVGAYEKQREMVKEVFPSGYIEVYVKCSYEECAKRDVKGYYDKAKRGKIKNLNGADDTFQIPQNSHITIDTEKMTVKEAVDIITAYLEKNEFI